MSSVDSPMETTPVLDDKSDHKRVRYLLLLKNSWKIPMKFTLNAIFDLFYFDTNQIQTEKPM